MSTKQEKRKEVQRKIFLNILTILNKREGQDDYVVFIDEMDDGNKREIESKIPEIKMYYRGSGNLRFDSEDERRIYRILKFVFEKNKYTVNTVTKIENKQRINGIACYIK